MALRMPATSVLELAGADDTAVKHSTVLVPECHTQCRRNQHRASEATLRHRSQARAQSRCWRCVAALQLRRTEVSAEVWECRLVPHPCQGTGKKQKPRHLFRLHSVRVKVGPIEGMALGILSWVEYFCVQIMPGSLCRRPLWGQLQRLRRWVAASRRVAW